MPFGVGLFGIIGNGAKFDFPKKCLTKISFGGIIYLKSILSKGKL